jgi:hypothetical protein
MARRRRNASANIGSPAPSRLARELASVAEKLNRLDAA